MRHALIMLSNGSRLREIQAETGLSPKSVSNAARQNGVVRGVFLENRIAVRLVTEKGMSVPEAAKAAGVPEHRIYYALRKQTPGQFRKKRRINRNADISKWAEIHEMRAGGASLGEIGVWFAMSRQRVHQILAKYKNYLAEQAKQTGE